MSFQRGIDGSDALPSERLARVVRPEHRRQAVRTGQMATGTLACPQCDAPVVPAGRRQSPADPLGCPFCRHHGAVRDFLSLATPARPARVAVRVVSRADRTAG